jgi:hypothetical protein
MKISDFREYRGLPFVKRGMRVEMDGKPGRVAGANSSANLDIIFDGDNYSQNCHPYWRMKYFGNGGEVIKEFND